MARIIAQGLPSFMTADRTNLRLGINSTTPGNTLDVRTGETSQHPIRVQNTDASGHSAIAPYDSSGNVKGAFGYANASVSGSRASKLHVTIGSGVDFLLTDVTVNYLYVKQSTTIPQIVFGSATATANRFVDIQQPAVNAANLLVTCAIQSGAHTNYTAGGSWRCLSVQGNVTLDFDAGGVGAGNIRCAQFFPPTIQADGASTFTDPTCLYISAAPTASTNATFTDAFAFFVDAGRVRLDQAIAMGGGAAPTLGTIGGSGPAAAAQNEWIEITTQNGRRWVPAWA